MKAKAAGLVIRRYLVSDNDNKTIEINYDNC